MRRTSIIAAVIGSALVASSSFAGFTVTATLFGTASGLDQYRIVAVNTGGDTGVQVKGLEYNYAGAPAAFEVTDTTDPSGGDPDGIPDLANLLSATRTRIRVSATASNNTFVGVTPDAGPVQPNAYAAGRTSFSGAIANTGTTNASGAGFEISRIFLPAGQSGVFSGNIGGDLGTKVPFSVNLVSGGGNLPPVLNPATQTVNVVFGQIVTNGANFTATVQVTDPNVADTLTLAFGTPIPGSVSNLQIAGATGTSPRTFTVSGTVNYSANGTDVVIPIVANDGAATTNGSITLHVTPEPASLGLIGLSTLLLGRRRK